MRGGKKSVANSGSRLHRPWRAARAIFVASEIVFVCCLCLSPSVSGEDSASAWTYNRDIRPILAENCFACHGPDARARQGDLRLDQSAEAKKDRGGYAAVAPGKPDESAVIARITSADPDELMPPPGSHRQLTADQITKLRSWIEAGAVYEPHWALIAPAHVEPPKVTGERWVRNPIDRFVLARLEREGLHPSPEADRETLLRRVTLDLTGLPPTIAEIDAFLLDNSAEAYESVVDRLLASPRYGERMAVPWLDAARYADTQGYQDDGPREMWRWRDWAIEAFNANMPFDQFTVEQLAGDLLPDATQGQRTATGFNRNQRGNSEGGIIPEEYLLEYAVDRVEATSTVWLGLTLGCARCHDHKFDPFTQREFYQVLAYFNNVPELGRVRKRGNSPPLILAPTDEQRQQMEQLDRSLAESQAALAALEPEIASAQAAWEAKFDASSSADWNFPTGLVVHFPFDGTVANVLREKADAKLVGGDASFAPGMIGQAIALNGAQHVDAGDLANFSQDDRFSYGAWVYPQGDGAILSRLDDEKQYEGYDVLLAGGKVKVYMGSRELDDAIILETVESVPSGEWHHVMVTYDATQYARGVNIYLDGERAELIVHNDSSNNPFRSTQPLRIGSRSASAYFRGQLDEVRIYDHELTQEEVRALAAVEPVSSIVAIDESKRTPAQRSKLRSYFLQTGAPEQARTHYQRITQLRADRLTLHDVIPDVMVMAEMNPPRETFVLARGEYDKPGERVERAMPASLPPLPAGAPNDRLGFARWLVDPANPLCARVAVNRFWEMYFGVGLVKTTEDFGTQGELPSHPDLLDWLAGEFIRTGWDMKALHKLIVTSATYRQSSRVDSRLAALDPENRLLARGPRFRLSAGVIRDVALASSGLLVERIGGPSARPYQPEGLWEELANVKYEQDHGENLYRRSLYTFWKRTIAPPSMTTFDAATRETCVVRPLRTNTPLQALATLNEVTYVEAARALAERMLTEGGATAAARVTFAFRRVIGRHPKRQEVDLLVAGVEKQRARFAADPASAEKLIAYGEKKRDESLSAAELAAYATAASVILNLDEAITKE